jgi:hypothetical protein
VYNRVERAAFGDNLPHRLRIANVGLDEFKASMVSQRLKIPLLVGPVVGRVEIVQTDDFMLAGQQVPAGM